ncbi:glutamyl-tRNA reductase [Methylophaga sp. 42_25_T18]|nr:glutamyl-tRNA reductase [Methylophaga sp. 42_25_T18]OUR89658.1 glutamyl-tRNA reductase [Methylophaga sp. 42_8_T64]
MQLVTYGINHNTAPVNIREHIAFNADVLPAALDSLNQHPNVIEAVVVSTCNRTEIYCHLDGDYDNAISLWLHQFHQQPADSLTEYLYQYEGEDAIRHLLRVACGLDSMVLGEPQILGQIKTAYNQALNANTLGKSLGRLFQHAFSVAKQVRTDTAIGNSPVSVAFAAVSLAKQIFSKLADSTALLIGAGETIELAARHLKDNGVGRIIIANRTIEKAHTIALQVDGYAIGLSEMPAHLAEADIVISSTASQLPILGKGAVERALKQRKRRPIFMVDIAVPRDIEPEVGNLEDIYLYSVDDLHDIIEENIQSRRDAAQQAEEIIDTQVDHFIAWLRSQDAVPVIQAIRSNAETESDQLLQKSLKQLEQGIAPEQVMNEFARSFTNKLLHEPSRQLRQSGLDTDNNLVDATRRLFNIKD